MSIFTNNVIPSLPTGKTWNNVGYEIWIDLLNEDYDRRNNPNNMWFSSQDALDEYVLIWKNHRLWQTKNQIKTKLKTMRNLTRHMQECLDRVQETSYSKYGVWLKYKIQRDSRGWIKSVYFKKFC